MPPGTGGPIGYAPPPGGAGPYQPPGFGAPPGFGPPGSPPFNVLAIVSMVLGLLALPGTCCCWWLPFTVSPFSLAGLIVGIVCLAKIHNDPQASRGSGMAIAGIALSGLTLLLQTVFAFTTIDDSIRHSLTGGRL